MPLSFEDARAIVAAVQGRDAAPWGWENDEVFVMAYDYGDDPAPVGEPELLVDKYTGELWWVAGLGGRPPAPDLQPVGIHPRSESVSTAASGE